MDLTVKEKQVFGQLLGQVQAHSRKNLLRSEYHDSRKTLDRIGFSVPPSMRDFEISIGWAEKAVTVPAARIRPDGFTSVVTSSLVDEVNGVMQSDAVIAKERFATRSALEHGCSFVFVTPAPVLGDDPVVTVRSAAEASALFDARTGEVSAALEVVGLDEFILYLPGYYVAVSRDAVTGDWVSSRVRLGAPDTVACSVRSWQPTLRNPFGTSRVTRPLMGLIDTGVRTMLRQETTAEYFSAPQRALLGADEAHFTDKDGNRISPLSAMIGGAWGLPDVWDDDEGKLVRPELVQLSQASMVPHTEMMRSIASMVSSETTIPLGYLGVVHDNPSSAEAILASESDMVAMIEAELPNIGASRVDFAKKWLAVKYRADGEQLAAMRSDLRSLRAYFADPGTPTRAARADAALKFRTAFPDGDPVVAMEMYGLSREQIERNLTYSRKVSASAAIDALLANSGSVPEPSTNELNRQSEEEI